MIISRSASRSVFFTFCIFLSGCAPSFVHVRESIQSHPEQGHFIQGVPFFPQADLSCGPSALASLFNFYGRNISEEEIAREVVSPRLGGTLNLDLYIYVKAKGMRAEVLEGGIEALKKEIQRGHPVIAFINLGFRIYPIGHYIVIFGYNDEDQVLVVHWGSEAHRIIPYKKFQRSWRKTGEWALLVLPP